MLLSSGCSLELAAARAAAPDLPLASLHRRLADDWRRDVDAHGLCALGLDDDHLEIGQLQAVASARPDLALLVYTVNAPRRAAELAAAGVTSVFSDVPDVLTPPSHEPARAG